jgi:hypothetical protein
VQQPPLPGVGGKVRGFVTTDPRQLTLGVLPRERERPLLRRRERRLGGGIRRATLRVSSVIPRVDRQSVEFVRCLGLQSTKAVHPCLWLVEVSDNEVLLRARRRPAHREERIPKPSSRARAGNISAKTVAADVAVSVAGAAPGAEVLGAAAGVQDVPKCLCVNALSSRADRRRLVYRLLSWKTTPADLLLIDRAAAVLMGVA